MSYDRVFSCCAAVLAALLVTASCRTASVEQTVLYNNPVLPINCPDPSVIDDREGSGWFYAYSTCTFRDGKGVTLPVYRSRNLVDWEFVRDGFAQGKEPSWSPGGALWAPDVNRVDGRYVLYYAMGHWGDHVRSASGVAVSEGPTGPFVDQGMIVSCDNTGVMNSIDPVYFEDQGKRYLFWGSFGKGSGIWGVELSDDGLSVREGAKPVQLSAIDTEGAYLVRHGRWYYMFASRGTCCEGARSTYHVVVARSSQVLGPYEGPDGKSFLDGDYNHTVLSGSLDGTFRGPGHNSALIRDDAGQDWILYHAFNASDDYQSRCLMLDRVQWKKGWPVIETGQPSKQSSAPVFR